MAAFCANIIDMKTRIYTAIIIPAIVLALLPTSTFAVDHRSLSEDEIGAISQNCSSIKVRLQRVQRDDAKNRVYLGSQYESVATRLMLNLNLRLVKNGMANALLAEQQTTFMSERDRFKNDFIGYSQEFETLLNMNCKDEPEAFYRQLEVVRDKRADIDASMKRLKDITALHRQTIRDLKDEL